MIKGRRYFLLALSLLILATGFLAVGHKITADAQRLKAISLERAVKQHMQAVPDETAAIKSQDARNLMRIGLAHIFGGVISLTMAIIRKERGWYLLAILLLLLDIVMVMM